mmetsp:Transcript_9349/g.26713  ORF Transcript_9349/g.26713 Transcript_9349/m.26713 type:complete len:98 (+) Transcript_9349:322-615(+)
MAAAAPTSFTVMVTGHIELAEIPACDNAYCKYQVVHGEDWKFVDGQEDGITQVTRQSLGGAVTAGSAPLLSPLQGRARGKGGQASSFVPTDSHVRGS